jgi:hypothetical protein
MILMPPDKVAQQAGRPLPRHQTGISPSKSSSPESCTGICHRMQLYRIMGWIVWV